MSLRKTSSLMRRGLEDLEPLGLAELKGLQERVDARIRLVEKQQRAERVEALKKRADELGFSKADARAVFGGKGAGNSLKATVPKYRNPESGETWSGKGRPPNWVKRFIDQGGKLESIEIEKVE